AALLLVVAGIALLPTEPRFATLLVALYVLTRCLFSGSLTARSVIWRTNYPRHARSRITGRLIIINTLMLALLPLIAGKLFDADRGENAWLFRGVYLGAALIGTGSVYAYLGLRVRRERALRRDEAELTLGNADSGAPAARVSAIHVLLTDHHFRGYMVWQFMAGVATMAGNTAMMAFVAEQVARVPNDWPVGPFLVGFVLTDAIVQLFVALSIPFFAHYLDKVHVTRFRTRHGLLWIVTQASNLAITYLAAINGAPLAWLLVLLAVPRVLQGLVFGGGRLAWQLGHHDFADRHLAATYMSIHQTLTGVRGFIAPYAGVLLYTGLRGADLGPVRIPAWDGIGYWVFAITLGFAILGWLGFVRLDKQVGGDGAAKTHD
ncbi:MAG: MFS transporter, partial [Phycisphaeraceae bacterium]